MNIKFYNKETARQMKWLQQSTSKEQNRPVLTGFFVKYDKTVAVDGYTLFEAPTPDEFNEYLGKIIRPKRAIPVTPQLVEYEEIDGVFPDYEQVVPNGEPEFRIGLSREFLGRLRDMPADNDMLIVNFYGEKRPIKVESKVKTDDDVLRFTAVIMPMNIDE